MKRKSILFILMMGIFTFSAWATNYAIVVGIDDYLYLKPLTADGFSYSKGKKCETR